MRLGRDVHSLAPRAPRGTPDLLTWLWLALAPIGNTIIDSDYAEAEREGAV